MSPLEEHVSVIEVVVEKDKGHILYQDGERFNFLHKTIVVQDFRHHRSLHCEVEAWIYCADLGLALSHCSIENNELILPSGNIVECKDFSVIEKDDPDDPILVRFICDAIIKL